MKKTFDKYFQVRKSKTSKLTFQNFCSFEDGKNKLRRILGTDTSFLQIYQPFDSDNGNYSCHVTNKHGIVITESAILHATNKSLFCSNL